MFEDEFLSIKNQEDKHKNKKKEKISWEKATVFHFHRQDFFSNMEKKSDWQLNNQTVLQKIASECCWTIKCN